MILSLDLRASEGGVAGGEVAVFCAEVALQLGGGTGGEVDHRLQPESHRLGIRAPPISSREPQF